MDEEVAVGLLQRKDPRHHCLAYRRKLRAIDDNQSSNLIGSKNDPVDKVGQNPDPRQEELWQKVQQYLGSNQAREYAISSVFGRHGEPTADQETYLRKLSDDFVSDTKALIIQNLAKKQSDASSTQPVREAMHHAHLANEKLGSNTDGGNSGRYSGLFRRLQSYIKDPRQSCRPFLIHGPQGSDKSGTMSAVAATVSNWLSTFGVVTVLRFIGTTTESVDVQTCVASVRAQIQMSYGMDISPACESLCSELTTFRAVLEHVSRTSAHTEPLFILLDGMEGLQSHCDALEALWTVRHLPPNICLIMSATSGGQQTGKLDIVEALLTLITNPDLTYDIGSDNDGDFMQPGNRHHLSTDVLSPGLSLSPVEVLTSALAAMEADYGSMLVKYFAAYVTVTNVGILDSELFDLLASNDEVMAERRQVPFTPGIISILRQRLADFLSPRLVYGRVGFSWSKPEFRRTVAERYHVIAGTAGLEAEFSEQSASFTLTLHRHVVQIYHDIIEKSSVLRADTSVELDLENQGDQRITLQMLGPQNPIKANRVLHHLRVLLPVEGLDRLRSCIFDLDWLTSQLATSPVFHVINDVFSVYSLCQELHQQAIVTDPYEDIGVLFEFLQLSAKALFVNYLSLPAEVVTRLGSSCFVQKFPSVADLVSRSRRWLADTESVVAVPLWSVWDRPGGIRRHRLDGISHVIGPVDSGEALVGYGRHRVSIWRVQTGSMVHQFEVKPEQPIDGVMAARDGAFVIVWFYSHITRMTELGVLSTETGLALLSVSLPQEFEAAALSEDDELFAVAALVRTDTETGAGPTRMILGIHVTSRDVVFQLPVVDVHPEGISNHRVIRV